MTSSIATDWCLRMADKKHLANVLHQKCNNARSNLARNAMECKAMDILKSVKAGGVLSSFQHHRRNGVSHVQRQCYSEAENGDASNASVQLSLS